MMAMAASRFIFRASKLSVLLGLLLVAACSKVESGNETPMISYSGFDKYQNGLGKDSLLVIRFSFEDGNGDIGYTEGDTLAPFQIGDPFFYNLHTDFYGLNNGMKVYYVDVFSNDTISYNQRLQSITPEGKFKGISGTMELRVDFSILLLNGYSPNRIQLELWLNDRALNESNRILTPEIDLDI